MTEYLILFDTCGRFRRGDIAPASELGNVAYLLRVGAIAPTPPVVVEVPRPRRGTR